MCLGVNNLNNIETLPLLPIGLECFAALLARQPPFARESLAVFWPTAKKPTEQTNSPKGLSGQLTFNIAEKACYRCLFPVHLRKGRMDRYN